MSFRLLATALFAVLAVLLPKPAFQVPPRGQKPLELTATPKQASSSINKDTAKYLEHGNKDSLNKMIGVTELFVGLGMLALSTGAISLRSRGSLSLQASSNSDMVVRPKAWLAPGSKSDFVGMYGVTEPCGSKGEYYWDPANLAENMDRKKLRLFRSAEIKHGRVCMLATLGWLVQEKVRIPWLHAESAPNGFRGLQYFLNLPRMGDLGYTDDDAARTADAAGFLLISIILVCGYIEKNASDEGRDPGDFGDPAGWYALNKEFNKGGGGINGDLEFFRDCEINHCRLAMVGMFAAACAEYSSGFSAVSQQWAGTNSFFLEWLKDLPIRVLPGYMYSF
eukprot:TRINITY_DN99495_c0_g1_i1.p1 TRINITY_DN99495_c0_g1~~TRINITY_DN99495_c0_g1_i1.p1  ORF type:complete len:337 (+),score=62.40 TRINITY_DN99495_c0_g1_i1:47-1057(+)